MSDHDPTPPAPSPRAPRERLAASSGPDRATRRRHTVARRRRAGPLRWLGRLAGLVTGLIALLALAGSVAGYGLYRHYAADLPDVDGLKSYQPRVMSRVYAGDARLMAELATERRIFVPYAAIPDVVKHAFVSAEDQNFWLHRGVDPLAIVRAGVTDLSHMGQGKRPIGASTITQQVAKNMLLDNAVSLARKVREAILATRIEASLSKDRILELYLNEIYLGLQSYGVAAAAQAYFNKPLDQLSLPEAAFLATLPKAPNNYNPFRFPDAARDRRDWVLDRMAEDHAITAAEAAAAKAQPVIPAQFHRPEPLVAADWFAEEVRRRLIERFGPDTTTQGGLMVRTSMDPALQALAERTLRAGLVSYDHKLGGWRGAVGHVDLGRDPRGSWAGLLGQQTRPAGVLADWRQAVVIEATDAEARVGWLEGADPRVGTVALADIAWARPVKDGRPGAAPRRIADVMVPGDLVLIEPAKAGAAPAGKPERVTLRQIPAVQGALVSLDPGTGRVLALVGGWSFEQSQFNRATQAIRQPGSSFKPMVYLTALEQGISPSQQFLDAPIVIDQGGVRWRPNNYEMSFNGPTPLHVALEKSLNLVTLRVARTVGMDAVAQNAIAFHVVDDMPRVLPAALGAVGTTVLRMAGAYASLDMGGREVVPSLIDSVQDRDGHVVWRAPGRACDGCGGDPETPPAVIDDRRQIADPQSVFQMVTMMQGVVQHGTGYEAGKGLGRAIAGKTGTTQDFNDAWFVGFTPDLVTAVWVGYDNPASLGTNETGGAIAAPIWHDFMQVALADRPSLTFPAPDGVTLVTWGGGITDAFKSGQVPGASGAVGLANDFTGADLGPGAVSGASTTAGAAAVPGGATAAHGGVDTSMGGLY